MENEGDSAAKPVAELWFAIKPYEGGVFRVSEVHVDPYAVGDIWLVRGSERDVAVDTCSGLVPAGPVLEAIAGKPLLAVATNSSYDHAGGWYSFRERACHVLDAEALRNPSDDISDILDYLSDDMLWKLPREGFEAADYRNVGAEATRLLADGDRIDLGDRSLEVLHLPGRTLGGVAIWDASTGNLFTGDMLYDGDAGLDWPPEFPGPYCESLRRMRDLPVAYVHGGHYGRFDGARMQEIIAAQLAELAELES
jgi:glyoxylase-like metal-dependent hydrolase (beta-lactamase superfamily II)